MTFFKIFPDCRHFKSDRPCVFHKKYGVTCGSCEYYDQVRTRILIIKLASIGDVLRTTCILSGLKEKYASSHITWLSEENAAPILEGHQYIDELVSVAHYETPFRLQTETYDMMVNLDSSRFSCQLATFANGKEKFGFGLDESGHVCTLNKEAEEWFFMGLSDELKKANQKTYQEITLEICKLSTSSNHEIVLNLKSQEIEFGHDFVRKHGLGGRTIIGLNTGAGNRWQNKVWPESHFVDLIGLILNNTDFGILLLGGPEENLRNKQIMKKIGSKRVVNSGTDHTLREFASILNTCQVFVTGDTLALHIGIGLKKAVICLVGPTSATELDLYGMGEKITAEMDCLCCYLTRCDIHPNCMEGITPMRVLESIMRMT